MTGSWPAVALSSRLFLMFSYCMVLLEFEYHLIYVISLL